MGNYILMKNFTLFLLISNLLLANELSWVDEQVQAIKPSRQGIQIANIKTIKDPFIFLEKNRIKEDSKSTKKSSPAKIKKYSTSSTTTRRSTQRVQKTRTRRTYNSKNFTLNAIMNNTAMINGKWYSLGDKIKSYKISEITRVSVLLAKNGRQVLLSTKSKKQNLHFKNKQD